MGAHDNLVEDAKEAIDQVFMDLNVPPEATAESMDELIEYIQILKDTL